MSDQRLDLQLAGAVNRRTFLRAMGLASCSLVVACQRAALSGGSPMASDHDAIIIGTGFGAMVTATQLALVNPNRKRNILMLERGVWWFTPEREFPPYIKNHLDTQPIQYWPCPDHRRGILDFLSVVRSDQPLLSWLEELRRFRARPHPLYRYHSFEDIDILTASGVGGGSLIYSNVGIEPYFDAATQRYPVMENWPLELTKQDYINALGWMGGYRGTLSEVVTKFPPPLALRAQLNGLPADQQFLYLGKCRWLKDASKVLGKDPQWMQQVVERWAPLKLQVIEYTDHPTDAVNNKTYGERQGRCFPGCLPGVRHTLNKTLVSTHLKKNLLNPLNGQQPPVTLQSLAEVDHIEALPGGGYGVVYDDLRFGEFDARGRKSVTAPVVVLAAGCLGSTELLLCSRQHGLPLNDRLGHRFSTNGDYAGFIDYQPRDGRLNFNTAPFPIYAMRGPINASHVMFRDGKLFVNFEDATIPLMFARVVRDMLHLLTNATESSSFLSRVSGLWEAVVQDIAESPEPWKPKNFWTEHEMLQNTFFFNLMGGDEAGGVFELDGSNRLTLRFEGGPLARDPVYQKMEEIIQAMVSKMGSQYVRFPFWGRQGLLSNEPTPERKFVTVHPLGGCSLGNNFSDGVMDAKRTVFNTGAGGTSVHQGLYVANAAVVPGPVAVNPMLTIVALAQEITS